MNLPLQQFIEVVSEFRTGATEEGTFWNTQRAVDDFLSSPVSARHTALLQGFLALGGPLGACRLGAPRNAVDSRVQEMSRLCAGVRLSDHRLGEHMSVSGHSLPLRDICEILYGRLSMVSGIGGTNASKILCLSNPHLFVMWDAQNIRSLMGLGSKPSDYSEFLTDMEQYGKRLVSEQPLTRTAMSSPPCCGLSNCL